MCLDPLPRGLSRALAKKACSDQPSRGDQVNGIVDARRAHAVAQRGKSKDAVRRRFHVHSLKLG
jgi:hypothetical protein